MGNELYAYGVGRGEGPSNYFASIGKSCHVPQKVIWLSEGYDSFMPSYSRVQVNCSFYVRSPRNCIISEFDPNAWK